MLDKYGILGNIGPRFSTGGALSGVDYRKSDRDNFKSVIVWDASSRGLRYTNNQKNILLREDFKGMLNLAREEYTHLPDGIIDDEMNWDSYIPGFKEKTVERTEERELIANMRQGKRRGLKKAL